jgi:hypothetical protein
MAGHYVSPKEVNYRIIYTIEEEVFVASENGSVRMAGDVFAKTGVIGGFTIGSNSLSSDGVVISNKGIEFTTT